MKKNKLHIGKIILITILAAIFLLACNDNSDKTTSDNNANKLKTTQDSAKNDNQLMELGKDSLESQNEKLSQKEIEMEEILRQKQYQENLELTKTLQKNLKEKEDSLNVFTNNLSDINSKIEKLVEKKNYVSETNDKSKKSVTTNIADLEALINSLKIAKSDEESKLNLIEKRKGLVSKKSELLNTELEYKKSELNNLFSQQNKQDQIKEVTNKIAEINKDIEKNKNLLLEEELNQKLNQNKITDLEKQINENQKLFKSEYEKSSGFSDYVKKERENLDGQIKKLEGERVVFSNKWKKLTTQKDSLKSLLEEIQKTSDNNLVVENTTIEDSTIDKAAASGAKLSEINKTIEDNKPIAQIDSVKKEDVNNPAQKLLKESENLKESNNLFLYIFLLVILVVIFLYWLGKKNKANSKQ